MIITQRVNTPILALENKEEDVYKGRVREAEARGEERRKRTFIKLREPTMNSFRLGHFSAKLSGNLAK